MVVQAGVAEHLIDSSPGELPPGLELAAFRLIQEALTNIIKHAGASTARVLLAHAGGGVSGPARAASCDELLDQAPGERDVLNAGP